MKCNNCGIEFEGRADAKYCSPKCKLQAFRKQSIETDNVTFSKPIETDKFYFTVKYNRQPGDLGYDEDVAKQRNMKRLATYWYDVPLGAIPVRQKDWPEVPILVEATKDKPEVKMNGRQYFLWWKNNFKLQNDKTRQGFGQPEIFNPRPVYDSTMIKMGGQGSRHWGAA